MQDIYFDHILNSTIHSFITKKEREKSTTTYTNPIKTENVYLSNLFTDTDFMLRLFKECNLITQYMKFAEDFNLSEENKKKQNYYNSERENNVEANTNIQNNNNIKMSRINSNKKHCGNNFDFFKELINNDFNSENIEKNSSTINDNNFKNLMDIGEYTKHLNYKNFAENSTKTFNVFKNMFPNLNLINIDDNSLIN
jgi:hypothetical protein